MKTCSKCKKNKELSEFHNSQVHTDGLYPNCKECKREYDIKYRKSAKVQEYSKSKIYRDRKKEYRKWLSDTKPEKMIWTSAKYRAKVQNVPFNITVEDIVIPEYCPLLNTKLERKPYGKGGSFQPNSPSLDKIIPELGYVKDNIMVISMKANAMKYNASKEELVIFAENILKQFKN